MVLKAEKADLKAAREAAKRRVFRPYPSSKLQLRGETQTDWRKLIRYGGKSIAELNDQAYNAELKAAAANAEQRLIFNSSKVIKDINKRLNLLAHHLSGGRVDFTCQLLDHFEENELVFELSSQKGMTEERYKDFWNSARKVAAKFGFVPADLRSKVILTDSKTKICVNFYVSWPLVPKLEHL